MASGTIYSSSWRHTVVRPEAFLRWAGSKKQIVERLASFWSDNYSRYVEPFAGSSRLFFRIQPERALLADKNGQLIEAYKVVRSSPYELWRRLSGMPCDRDSYYRVRSLDPRQLGTIDRAARFIYLNRFCFNGIYRTNRGGNFNVPYGQTSDKKSRLPSIDELASCSRLLQRATLRDWDFGTTLRHTRRGDFVYLDPPYAVREKRVFREYSAHPFGLQDLERLQMHLKKIDARGVDFVVSYADCSDARAAFKEWRIVRIVVRRHVAGFTSARRLTHELIVTNIERLT